MRILIFTILTLVITSCSLDDKRELKGTIKTLKLTYIPLASDYANLATKILLGQADYPEKKLSGIEIYLLRDEYNNRNSFVNLSNKEMADLVKKHGNSTKNFPDSVCVNYIDYKNVQLPDQAFLKSSDIAHYLQAETTIVLTQSGVKKLSTLIKNVSGIPFVIVVNNKPVLTAWFWYPHSSEAPYRVYTMVEENSKNLKLNPPLCGKDPRNNKEMLVELEK